MAESDLTELRDKMLASANCLEPSVWLVLKNYLVKFGNYFLLFSSKMALNIPVKTEAFAMSAIVTELPTKWDL